MLVILGLLAAIATPQVMKYLSRARTQSAALQIHNLAASLDLYRLDVGRYPSQEEGLKSLVQASCEHAILEWTICKASRDA